MKQRFQQSLDCTDGILPTRLFTHREDVDLINHRELAQLPDETISYQAINSGEETFIRILQSNCNAKDNLKLKIGAQVILLKTISLSEGLVNGARGVVIRFTRETRRPVVRFMNGLEQSMGMEVFSLSMNGKIVATRTQIPLDLAWGISIHKSQGMSIDKAIIDLKRVFECGQSYGKISNVVVLEFHQ